MHANLILPRVGEVSRCGVLAKYDDVSFAKSLGTVVTERLIDTLTILVITGITFLIQMPVFLRFFEETGTKVPSLVHLVTSPWFYVVLFSIIGVLVLLYFLLRMLSFFEKVKGVVLNVWESAPAGRPARYARPAALCRSRRRGPVPRRKIRSSCTLLIPADEQPDDHRCAEHCRHGADGKLGGGEQAAGDEVAQQAERRPAQAAARQDEQRPGTAQQL